MTFSVTITAKIHVFGSVSGYTTLACDSGISASDREAMEILGFGQTDDRQYINALRTDPVAVGRPLPSGDYAVTRCLAGPPDSAGRATFRFISLVFRAAEWRDQVSLGLSSVLNQHAAWIWNAPGDATSVQVAVVPEQVDSRLRDVALQLVDGWINARRTKSIAAMRDSPEARRAMAIVPHLLPRGDRCGLRWGCGLLAAGVVTDICTLAAIAETSSRRKITWLPSSRSHAAAYVAALSQFWSPGEAPPLAFVSNVPSVFSFTEGARPSSSMVEELPWPARAKRVKGRLTRSAAVTLTVVTAVGLTVVAAGLMSGRSNPVPTSSPETAAPAATASSTEPIDGSQIVVQSAEKADMSMSSSEPPPLAAERVAPSGQPDTPPSQSSPADGAATPEHPATDVASQPTAPPNDSIQRPTDKITHVTEPEDATAPRTPITDREALVLEYDKAIRSAEQYDKCKTCKELTDLPAGYKPAPMPDLIAWRETLNDIDSFNKSIGEYRDIITLNSYEVLSRVMKQSAWKNAGILLRHVRSGHFGNVDDIVLIDLIRNTEFLSLHYSDMKPVVDLKKEVQRLEERAIKKKRK